MLREQESRDNFVTKRLARSTAIISWRKLLGRDPKFYDLLEASAAAARASTGLLSVLVERMRQPDAACDLREFNASRHEDKRLTREITEALCRTFVTPLEREDTEALAEALYKVPKRVHAVGERLLIYRDAVPALGENFRRQAAILEELARVVEGMVKDCAAAWTWKKPAA